MQDKIKEALKGLDTANDGHWTKEGLPNINFLKIVTGVNTLTREELEQVAPSFTRENAVLPEAQAEQAQQTPASTEQPKTGPVIEHSEQNQTSLTEDDNGKEGEFAGEIQINTGIRFNPLEHVYNSPEEEEHVLTNFKQELDQEINRLEQLKYNVVKRLDYFIITRQPENKNTMQQAIQLMHKQEQSSKQIVEKLTSQQKYPLDRVKASKK